MHSSPWQAWPLSPGMKPRILTRELPRALRVALDVTALLFALALMTAMPIPEAFGADTKPRFESPQRP